MKRGKMNKSRRENNWEQQEAVETGTWRKTETREDSLRQKI